jgi:RNA 2',3'-cyclic 3'-phosphodiesterase
MRTFIAIDLSKSAKREIEKKLYKTLKRKHWKVRWEKAEKLHLTLVFLGSILNKTQSSKVKSQNQVRLGQNHNLKLKIEQIRGCIKRAVVNIAPFTISFKGLGCFPDYEFPQVIWLGLKGNLQTLALIQKRIAVSLIKEKFKIDVRPFTAHITVGRVGKCTLGERREIGRQLKAMRILNLQSAVSVDKLVVYESKLSSKGSKYLKVEEIHLKNSKH